MSLHSWCRQGPCNPNSCTTFMHNSHWGRAATGKKQKQQQQKKKPCICAFRVSSVVSNSLWPCRLWPVRLLCQGVLQARIMDRIGQYCLPYPSRALYFLLPLLQIPLNTWCCRNPCDPSSCTTSTPGPHSGKPKSSRAASQAKPQWMTHM